MSTPHRRGGGDPAPPGIGNIPAPGDYTIEPLNLTL